MHCNALQRAAMHCNALQQTYRLSTVALPLMMMISLMTTQSSNTLQQQHTATHMQTIDCSPANDDEE